jgi:hypothetical protein
MLMKKVTIESSSMSRPIGGGMNVDADALIG